MLGGAVGRRRDRPDTRRRAGLGSERVVGQVRGQVGAHGHRTDSGAAATVRDAEGLVQVEVGDVGAELARLGQPDERVEVGAVDVDLAAGVVDETAQLGDGVLEDAVRRGVGHHDRREVVAVLRRPWRAGRPCRCHRRRAVLTTTTFMPAITALAALVPCALAGIRQMRRW